MWNALILGAICLFRSENRSGLQLIARKLSIVTTMHATLFLSLWMEAQGIQCPTPKTLGEHPLFVMIEEEECCTHSKHHISFQEIWVPILAMTQIFIQSENLDLSTPLPTPQILSLRAVYAILLLEYISDLHSNSPQHHYLLKYHSLYQSHYNFIQIDALLLMINIQNPCCGAITSYSIYCIYHF